MGTTKSKHFDTPAQFAEWVDAERKANRMGRSNYWYSDYEVNPGIANLRNGNNENVAAAEKMLDTFTQSVEVPTLVWQHNVAGAFPDVPAYLAGDPESMWSQEPDLSDRSPLRIWIGLTSSGGIDEKDLVKRGTVLAAFAIAMSARRPVLLTPYVNLGGSFNKGTIISWDIRTSPMILADVLASLSHAEVTRTVGLAACYLLDNDMTGKWHPDAFKEHKMRELLGCAPTDMYLSSIHLTDPILDNPVKWLSQQIERYTDPDSTPEYTPPTLTSENTGGSRYTQSSSSSRYSGRRKSRY